MTYVTFLNVTCDSDHVIPKLRVRMGCYQTSIPYISIGNCNSELILGMRASFRILYKNMTSYPIISKFYIFVTSSLRYSIDFRRD